MTIYFVPGSTIKTKMFKLSSTRYRTILILCSIIIGTFFRQIDAEIVQVIYGGTTLSWTDALSYCFSMNGSLENNLTLIDRNRPNNDKEMWIGQYKKITPWIGVWGCFKINRSHTTAHILPFEDIYQCQKRCRGKTLFTVKDETCLCLDSEMSLQGDGRNFSLCCSNTNKKCDANYFMVYRQNVSVDDDKKKEMCLSAACRLDGSSYKLYISSWDCLSTIKSSCNDNREVSPSTYNDANNDCLHGHSFLKYISNEYCDEQPKNKTGELWQGSCRKEVQFYVDGYESDLGNPTVCGYASVNDENKLTIKDDDCSRKKNFMCRVFAGTTIALSNAPTTTDTLLTGVLAGILIAVLLLVTIIVTVFICKRRNVNTALTKPLGNKAINGEPRSDIHQNRMSSPYSEINDAELNANQNCKDDYSLAVPFCGVNSEPQNQNSTDKLNSKRMLGNYDKVMHNTSPRIKENDTMKSSTRIDKFTAESGTDKFNLSKANISGSADAVHWKKADKVSSVSVRLNLKTFEDENMVSTGGDYCLANPLEEDNHHYVTNNTEYDHLNNVKKQKDNVLCKVYDHVTIPVDSDATYDHSDSNLLKPVNTNYDHFMTNNAD